MTDKQPGITFGGSYPIQTMTCELVISDDDLRAYSEAAIAVFSEALVTALQERSAALEAQGAGEAPPPAPAHIDTFLPQGDPSAAMTLLRLTRNLAEAEAAYQRADAAKDAAALHADELADRYREARRAYERHHRQMIEQYQEEAKTP